MMVQAGVVHCSMYLGGHLLVACVVEEGPHPLLCSGGGVEVMGHWCLRIVLSCRGVWVQFPDNVKNRLSHHSWVKVEERGKLNIEQTSPSSCFRWCCLGGYRVDTAGEPFLLFSGDRLWDHPGASAHCRGFPAEALDP